jgi:hypothetical protein
MRVESREQHRLGDQVIHAVHLATVFRHDDPENESDPLRHGVRGGSANFTCYTDEAAEPFAVGAEFELELKPVEAGS